MREVQAQIQITAAFSREATTAAATYADKQAIAARQANNEEEARKWDEGGVYRVALHSAIGLLTGNLSGGAGSLLSATALPEIGEMIAGMGLPEAVRVALTQVAGLALGAATGTVAGAASSFNTAQNYVSHSPFASVRQDVSRENARLLRECGRDCTQADLLRIDQQVAKVERAANLAAIAQRSSMTEAQAKQLAQLIAELVPIYGTGESLLQVVTGNSSITGEEANRFWSALALVPLAGGAIRRVGERAAEAVSAWMRASGKAVEVANASNYRTLFMKARPDLPAGWQVHHSMPQKYEELMRVAGLNINDVQFLRGVSPELHSRITTEWGRFDRAAGGNPSATQVAEFAKQIDRIYGGSFVWPGF